MVRHPRADLSRVRTISIRARKSKVTPEQFAVPFQKDKDSFARFVKGMPDILVARDLRLLVDDIVRSARKRKPVVVMIGGHVIKVGLAPVLIDLMRRKVITAVAMNSAAAIHDVETALWGKTSEDVAANMMDGRFGMARETAEFINGTLLEASRGPDQGYGEALGARLAAVKAQYRKVSLLASAYTLGIPATVHAAIGTDTIHQQPTMDGGVTGEMSFRDFRTLCAVCGRLTKDGVVLNIGSAVILPEVFLKALTVARNLGARAKGFTTAVFDMNAHYRPTMNVQRRPTQDGGKGLYIIGHHEIMVPLLGAMIVSRMRHE